MDSNSGRIAKNTGFLYLRSLVVMLIALYTSRIVLRVLGVEDYGIYNVVGGVIALLSTLQNTMQATYQRYYNVEMGKNNPCGVSKMFQLSLSSQTIIAAIVIVLAETIGVWFAYNKLVIPDNRMVAAMWVYQASVIKFCVSIFSSPFIALITAHEKMGFFAFVSIIDSVLQLAIVFLIQLIPGDNLIIYACLQVLIGLINIALYIAYCKRNIEETIIGFDWGHGLKSMFVFSGWSIFGEMGAMIKTQGIDIILNMFFGPIVNAARGVAAQILKAVNQFISSFQTSFRPQLTKSYASGDNDYMRKLYYSATKISYYLIFTLSLPILIETPYILHLWLGENVPDHTSIFTQLVLLTAFINVFSNPTSCIAYATGKIKYFSIVVGVGNILILPIAWVVLKLGYAPASAMYVSLLMTLLIQIGRIMVTASIAPVKISSYLISVILPTTLYSVLCSIAPLLIVHSISSSLFRFVLNVFLSISSCIVFAWLIGLNNTEKQFVLKKIKPIWNKIVNK